MRALPKCSALLVLLFASTAALAHPALWVTKSPTATVYLFGTIHALPKDVKWHYPTLDKAIAASDSLYVEVDDNSRAKLKALILKYGTSDADRADSGSIFDRQGVYPHADYVWKWHRLSSALDPADRQRLQIAAKRADLPQGVGTLESMRPWLAALTLANASSRRSGYEPQFGADTALEHEFKAQGKSIHSFETTRDQIEFFADTPPSLQLDLLRSVLEDKTRGSAQTATLVQDWQAGDVNAIADELNASILMHYPELYDVLQVTRNRDFARQIEYVLGQHGTFFVAVGAGHLAGPDSVQAQLAKLGIHTERVH